MPYRKTHMFLPLALQTILPAVLTGAFMLAERRDPKWRALSPKIQQAVIGVAFGLAAIFATETGVRVIDGGVTNVRDAAPVVAGLVFGAPAGIIAGVLGAAERWLCVLWGGGHTTRLACTLGTLVAGFGPAALRVFVFENRRPVFGYAFAIGLTTEVVHMMLVLLTNMDNLVVAFNYVEECAGLMISLCALACGLAVIGQSFINHEKIAVRPPRLVDDLGVRLFCIIFFAFLVVTGFTVQIAGQLTQDSSGSVNVLHVITYLMVFMEILVHTALFIVLFQLLRKRVVGNLAKVEQGMDAIAEGNLDTRVNVHTHQEFVNLSNDVNAMVDALKGYISEAEHRRDTELELARQIQRSALPNVFPPFPERGDFDLFASMDPAREVGGDFYDFFLYDQSTLVFLVADVSGKGVPAALFMMKAKAEIHSLMESGLDPDEAFTKANSSLCQDNASEMFVTAWLGKLDLATGTLTFANAGHNPPLLKRAGGSWEYLKMERPNLFLAGMDGVRYRKQTLSLGPGDRLFLYTDGVTEAQAADGCMFGENLLLQQLNSTDGDSPRRACENALAAVRSFAQGAEQSDDITMLAVDIYALRGVDHLMTRADDASIELMRAFFAERLPRLGASTVTLNRVQVAVDEVYSNICHYSGATRAVGAVSRAGNELSIEFADNGAAFDPTAAPEPDTTLSVEDRPIGGLGILMLRKMAKRMDYVRAGDTNILTLSFKL